MAMFTCPLPSGINDFALLLNIPPTNHEQTKLAREYIELVRQQERETWRVAAGLFYQMEFHLDWYQNSMQGEIDQANNVIRLARQGMIPNPGTPEEQVNYYKKLYVEDCTSRNFYLTELASLTAKLSTLNNVANKSWLDPKKSLPCDIQNSQKCFK